MFNKFSKLSRKGMELMSGVWRYNVESKFRPLTPRSVMINLTYKCNSRCVMCNIWKIRPKNELTYNDWEKIAQDNLFGDIRNLAISGGEPSLFPEYVKTVKMLIDSMPKVRRVVINSNGFMTEKIVENMEEIAKHCLKKGVKLAANVSIDGVGEVHDKIRGIKGGFDRCEKTVDGFLKLSKKYHFEVVVPSIIMRQNLEHYPKMKQWFTKKGVIGAFQIIGFHDTYIRNSETENALGINTAHKNKFVEVLDDIIKSAGKNDLSKYYWEDMKSMYMKGSSRTTPCSFLKDDFVVDSMGDVYYCLSVRPIGNVIKENRGVGEILFDPKNLAFRKNLVRSACKKCNSGCNSVWSTAFDAKRYVYYRLFGRLWPAKELDVR